MSATPPVSPPDQILAQLVFGKIVSMAISVVAKLRIADKLATGPKTVAELSAETQTNEKYLGRVLRLVTSVGVFRTEETGRLHLTPVGELLRTGVKGSMRGMADYVGSDWNWRTYGHLLFSVTTGKTAFDEVFGEPCFDWLAKHPDDSAVFNEGMVGFSSMVGEAVVAAYDFSKFKTLIDVGGGHGAILLAILKAFPKLQGVVFDAPHVVAGANEPIRAAGVADRCTAVGGNFFEAVPASDAYILKHIIHDWNDADCGRILTAIRKAAQPGAKLLLVEAVVPPGDAPHFAKVIDLEMMLIASGQERTEAEYRALLAMHGFKLERVLDTQSPMNIIEAVAV